MRATGHYRRLAVLASLLAAATLSLAPAAMGDEANEIVQACLNGRSLSGYSQSAYKKALKELQATTEEYSSCGMQIREAQVAAATAHTSRKSGAAEAAAPAAISATPTEQNEIAGAARAGSGPISLDGRVIHPGVIHGNVASTFSTLPGPLLAAMAFLVLCLLVIGGGALRNRVRDDRAD